jgi:hypothetical protein
MHRSPRTDPELAASAGTIGRLLGWTPAESAALAASVAGAPWRHCYRADLRRLGTLGGAASTAAGAGPAWPGGGQRPDVPGAPSGGA